ncbi:hypothetical protein Cgig2_024140 [Carnegiea gigantea]|uniref:Uncharacterized protein n=1 Tax=Carnegiea gigantea TaxID=171969 RepID=A0A9Q1GXI2_9CARY|nr:hypothetical protein Cgig2_024140 [Carnegiea gigantea]
MMSSLRQQKGVTILKFFRGSKVKTILNLDKSLETDMNIDTEIIFVGSEMAKIKNKNSESGYSKDVKVRAIEDSGVNVNSKDQAEWWRLQRNSAEPNESPLLELLGSWQALSSYQSSESFVHALFEFDHVMQVWNCSLFATIIHDLNLRCIQGAIGVVSKTDRAMDTSFGGPEMEEANACYFALQHTWALGYKKIGEYSSSYPCLSPTLFL